MMIFTLWRRALFRLSGRLPCRIISDGETPYLERYYVAKVFGTRIYMHRFVASDPDRGLHDHPWRWAFSIILAGWYYERNRYGERRVRLFNKITGDTFHRVILPVFPIYKYELNSSGVYCWRPRPVWTLFMHKAKREKTWGFLRDKGELGIAYTPYVYRHDEAGKEEEWWKTAPAGRFVEGRQS